MKKEDAILFSGAAQGAETYFGESAEKYGIEEINFTFEGRKTDRTRGLRTLNHEELEQGDVSLTYISKIMNRKYSKTDSFRKIIQTIWHQINSSDEVFVIGEILDDNTIKGGTGWGAEFTKLCNKPLYVFDQKQDTWFTWNKKEWEKTSAPVITEKHFCGTGTRYLKDNAQKAIDGLFERSFS